MKDDGGGRKQGVTVRFVRLRRHALLLPYRSFFRIGNESSRTEKQELRTESEVDVIIPGGAVAIEKVLNPLVGADTGRVLVADEGDAGRCLDGWLSVVGWDPRVGELLAGADVDGVELLGVLVPQLASDQGSDVLVVAEV